VSLDTLKNTSQPVKKPITQKDRAASAEDMHKLKDLIAQKSQVAQKEEIATSTQNATPSPAAATRGSEAKKKQVKEVPEDVLRKILEE
jgi:hypothetical protein